jgi:hypothetical protein
MTTYASVILVSRPEENTNNSRTLGDFEFLQLPRIGEEVSLPVLTNEKLSYAFDGYTVRNIIHRPREMPRVNNPHAPSEDGVELHTIIWIVGE